jgi:hypothetical protein
MGLMRLEEFISSKTARNAYVKEVGFKTLYVRKNKKRFISGRFVYTVLDIASLETLHPGEGNWTSLFNRIREKYPEWTIFVENVMNPKFEEILVSQGFAIAEPQLNPPCFYYPGTDFHKQVTWEPDRPYEDGLFWKDK